ncbi:MAG: hypothetical protein ACTSYA_07155 [Candidatus Kariarchaeaceae archaeon]
MARECTQCGEEVNEKWLFCRFCGNRVKSEFSSESSDSLSYEESISEDFDEIDDLSTPEEVIDELSLEEVFLIITTRDKRRSLNTKKKDLSAEIDKLLDRIKLKLLPREDALKELSQLKNQTEEVEKLEASLPVISQDLIPLEILIEDEQVAKGKLYEINALRKEGTVSKDTIRKAKQEYESQLNSIKAELGLELGRMRAWHADLNQDLKEKRSKLEMLIVRKRTGELTEDEYEEKRAKHAEEIKSVEFGSEFIGRLIKQAKQ